MALQPLFAIMAVGVIFVCTYTVRLATKTTDIAWVRHEDNPNNVLSDKQFHMLNPAGYDLTKKNGAPDYRSK